jgi:hypothetical protein
VAACLSVPLAGWADHGDDRGSNPGAVSTERHGGGHDDNGAGTVTTGGNPAGNDGDDQAGAGAQQNQPGNQPGPLQRTRIRLAATDAGNAIGAEGRADLRIQGSQERLAVEMEANVADGTVFTLTANAIPIGVVTIQLGEGEFEFNSENGQSLAGGLLPDAMTSLVLSDSSNAVVLQAQFGALSSGNPPLSPVLAVRKRVQLTASDLGATIAAEGSADLRSQGVDSRLKLEVEAKVADGTVWSVVVNGNVALGSLTFSLMESELRLDTAALANAGITDVSTITSVQINDAGGNAVLSATF